MNGKDPTAEGSPRWRAIYAVVARIPRGRVATYGQVAALAGYPGQARQVGYALAGSPEDLDLPWQRVINVKGEVSPRTWSNMHEFQQVLLEREGIVFKGARLDMKRSRWNPEAH